MTNSRKNVKDLLNTMVYHKFKMAKMFEETDKELARQYRAEANGLQNALNMLNSDEFFKAMSEIYKE